jgi:hypothetical protein
MPFDLNSEYILFKKCSSLLSIPYYSSVFSFIAEKTVLIMWKNMVQPGRSQKVTRCALIA